MKKIFYILMLASCVTAYSIYAEDGEEDFLIQQEVYSDDNGGDEDFKISCGDCGSGDDERAKVNASEEWDQ